MAVQHFGIEVMVNWCLKGSWSDSRFGIPERETFGDSPFENQNKEKRDCLNPLGKVSTQAMVQANSLFSLDTEYSADSTEFCPFQNKSKYLACGTYQLYNDQEPNEQPADSDKAMQRKGRLYLYKLEKHDQKVYL